MGGLSYNRVCELLLVKMKTMGWEPSQFGMHSFPDRLFKWHGHWTTKDGSVEKHLELL